MQLNGARVLLTGASGGIGQALAVELAGRGARLGLAGRRRAALEALRGQLPGTVAIAGDLVSTAGREAAVARMEEAFGGTDILVNNAGTSAFAAFATQSDSVLEQIIATNLVAPMALTCAVLPGMRARSRGCIVNIGSVFGQVGFAWFSAYSASKFGLRGFSEALRRELAGTGVEVLYAAPRAVRTPLNSPAVYRLAKQTGMAMDEPAAVARQIVDALVRGRAELCIGFPESLLVRVNALLPRLVDRALRRQNRAGEALLRS